MSISRGGIVRKDGKYVRREIVTPVWNEVTLHLEDEKEKIVICWRGTCRLEKAIDELKRLVEEGIKVKMR